MLKRIEALAEFDLEDFYRAELSEQTAIVQAAQGGLARPFADVGERTARSRLSGRG